MKVLRPVPWIAAGAIVAALTAGAAAAQFYVVQDKATQQCRIVGEKPTGNTGEAPTVGPAHPTQVEAEAAMRRIPDCAGSATATTPAEK